MKLTILILLSLAACIHQIHLADLATDERRAVDAAIAGWREAGLKLNSRCHLEAARIVRTTDKEFRWRCRNDPKYAAACLNYEHVGSHAIPVVVLRPDQEIIDSTGGPVIHELLHAASNCALDDLDPYHRNPLVWIAAGDTKEIREASAQRRARRIVLEE